MSIKFNRRHLVAMGSSLLVSSILLKRSLIDKHGPRSFNGSVIGANFKRGHRLLRNDFPDPRIVYKRKVSIVGSGVSGLSSAYHLRKSGVEDVEIFELEDHFGGKSTSFKESAPWGAHYLPLVNSDNISLLSFLKEAEVVLSESENLTQYNSFHLCSDPMEKLFIYGRMQEGIVPKNNLSEKDAKSFEVFFKEVEKLRFTKGSDGKYAFNIPMAESSSDEKFLKYDRITMSEYLDSLGASGSAFRWYINYCCRDDYGMNIEDISAWAGLHYFSSRRGRGAEAHDDSVLTWPQGNGYLVGKLNDLSKYPIQKGCMLFKIEGQNLYFYNFLNKESFIVQSEQIILALPQFIIARLLGRESLTDYSPWMVANLEIDWDDEIAASLAWDNVNFHGKGVGFVSANHQSINRHKQSNYLTYYWPLSHLKPKEARHFALKRTHEQWCADIMEDMIPMIPDLEKRVRSIDIWPWGHAMVTAPPGFIHDKRLGIFANETSSLHFAHTDLSGLSLFEEGFYRGEKAARSVVESLNGG